MTDVVERTAQLRVVRRRDGNSIRLALGRLTTLGQADRIRYGDMIERSQLILPDRPLMLSGATLGARKMQLRDWMMGTGTRQEVAEAIASALRTKVNYVHYISGVLLVEYKDR